MNIQEAVEKAISSKAYIARQKYDDAKAFHKTRIKPTNSYDTCLVYTFDQKGREVHHCKNWNPTAEDLMANDWKVFKE